MKQRILGFQNAKTSKGEAAGYLTGILYLTPYKGSGVNLCPNATAGCAKACLYTAGRASIFGDINKGRLRKTKWFLKDRPGFVSQLETEIRSAVTKARKLGLKPAIRLNGTSDLPWEHIIEMGKFPVQFYDYTKSFVRMQRYLKGLMPPNYYLTFSLSESNHHEAESILDGGGNVAAVVKGHKPKYGVHAASARINRRVFTCIDGDRNDLRFKDGSGGRVVALSPKGRARRDKTGFVLESETIRYEGVHA